jgi:hypothetical protein
MAMTRTQSVLVWGGLAATAVYALWRNTASARVPGPTMVNPGGALAYTPEALGLAVPGVSFAPSTVAPGILTSTLTAVPAVSSAQVSGAQRFWSTLQPVAPLDEGYIAFPSGSQVAASLMGGGNTAMDANGNYYVFWAGQVYQLGSMDSSGNWPARSVG